MLRDKTDFFLKDPRKNLGDFPFNRSLRHNVISSSSVRYTSSRSEPTMFLWSRQQHRGQQGRCCICSCPLTDYMERCEGQRPLIEGICDSVWTQESTCTVLETRITNCKKCIHNCVSKCWKPSEYPCVQIYVNLSSTGSRVLLHHTHESVRFNPECFCATKCSKNRAETEMLIASITENSTQFQPISFPCYYDPEGRQNNVLLTRFDLSNAMLHLSFWPSCIFLGGIVIIVMVKLTQYLSLLSEQSQMRKK
ncbi:calcium-activated potassium channel subunit beta-2 isoform X7 [Rhincodon typus]|uniref:calcium-activated potassium channel subunit beta-2 isoform X7 n=1 Tax=Rhincodon typus TaxID=259920 RepID=UPI00202FBDBA|nr:calcium-activated potassium channel subunit beta-2 isoform X7 [Rhincodon typus]